MNNNSTELCGQSQAAALHFTGSEMQVSTADIKQATAQRLICVHALSAQPLLGCLVTVLQLAQLLSKKAANAHP
jgi:hypothetical protein